jgi:hypothetical protein
MEKNNVTKDSKPQSILNHMISDFTETANDLFSVTVNPELIQGEKALYGKLIVKPSKRVARLLTIDREILVLFTNFEEQQVRTISQAKKLIDELHPRVESTVAIIVHKDKNSNNNLKKWGRENGISILPICYIENRFPQRDDLENILLGELYSHDPFDITGPVSDDTQFYGRRTEAQDLARKLTSGQIRSCLGIRKIGKTSLLNRIISEIKNYHNSICVVIDCSKDPIWNSNAITLLNAIADSIKYCVENGNTYYSINEVKESLNNISVISQQILSELTKTDKTIIVFFDEVDYITPSSPTTRIWKNEFNIFWRNFRAIYQDNKRQNDNLGMFICGVSSKWFTIESINNVENAALSLVPEEYLSPLPRGASIPMIKTLARTSGLQIDDETASYIAEFTCDIPFWTRKACSFIHRNIQIEGRPVIVEKETAKSLLDDFLITEGAILSQVAIKHLFRVFPELKDIVINCHNKTFENLPYSLLSKLPKYGIANLKGKTYIFGNMMNSGIKNIIDEDKSTPSEIIDDHTETKHILSSATEWADELAVLGKNRNLLEKKLRGICLNFIRFDSLSNKTKGTLTERLLRIVDENIRKNYKDLSGEQIVEKFLWTDLTKLIVKEWTLFERLFNDKNQFTLNSSIINERPDAHAKDYQVEDFALYKRALNWFEEKIRVNS